MFSKLFAVLLAITGLPLLLLMDAPPAAAAALQASPTFEPAECWFDSPIPFLPGPAFECGYVSVPERHETPDGPWIKIPVAIARAEGENVQPDPLFLAQGGPGGDAFEVFPILLNASPILQSRDIVVFNQRGTRYAVPDLSCTEIFDGAGEILALGADEGDARSLELLQTCYDRLAAEGIDLSAYNSVQNAADVQAIRQALGYDQYNFYGVSYGTLLGLHLLRDHPEGLRSVILDGVVPTDLNFIPKVTENTDRVFKEIIQTCEDSPQCQADYPNLEARFFALVDKLNDAPITVTLRDSETGERYPARLDGDTLVSVLFQAFYLPHAYAYFPKLVENLEAGDMTFVEGIWPLFAFDRTMSEGMYFSVICAEDADFDASETDLSHVNPYFAEGAEDELDSYREACDIWRVDRLPDSVDDPVSSEIPALLLSGQYDPITPPYFAEVAAASLGNEQTVVEPTGSHGVAFGDACINVILIQFLNQPDRDIDDSCLSEIEPKAFAPIDAISFPLVGEINTLSEALPLRLGVSAGLLLIVLTAFIVLPLSWLIRVFRSQKPVESQQERRLRRLAGVLSLLFGFAAMVFVGGVAYYAFDAIFSGLATIFAVSGDAAPFFIISLLLPILALGMAVIAIVAWMRRYWPAWARIYYSIISLAAVGYVIALAAGGMFTVLL
ncbi:MAG: alpha/beta fold hydrolase [Candidatus Promineifilaceae bacterium]